MIIIQRGRECGVGQMGWAGWAGLQRVDGVGGVDAEARAGAKTLRDPNVRASQRLVTLWPLRPRGALWPRRPRGATRDGR